jgi:hypothetical protein
MARGCQVCSHQSATPESRDSSAGNSSANVRVYSESTILPGATKVENGEPEICLGAPVNES